MRDNVVPESISVSADSPDLLRAGIIVAEAVKANIAHWQFIQQGKHIYGIAIEDGSTKGDCQIGSMPSDHLSEKFVRRGEQTDEHAQYRGFDRFSGCNKVTGAAGRLGKTPQMTFRDCYRYRR